MVDETSKTRLVRGEDFDKKYLQGKVLDIGAGKDRVCAHAEGFDTEDGDANRILDFQERDSYNTVYSSHCLEHMFDPPRALQQWWELVKPGGYLVLVVPDEDLYEQGIWPSIFNTDHKATFRMDSTPSWSPVSYDIGSLISALPKAVIVSLERHDMHYDYRLMAKPGEAWRPKTFLVKHLYRIARQTPSGMKPTCRRWVDRFARFRKIPVDQTLGPALAQIQVIAQKQDDQHRSPSIDSSNAS